MNTDADILALGYGLLLAFMAALAFHSPLHALLQLALAFLLRNLC